MHGRERVEPNDFGCTCLLTNPESLELEAGKGPWKPLVGFSTGEFAPTLREVYLGASGEKSCGLTLQFSLCTERLICVL